jgi:myo-inositol-hexaphosphate 3-phosphohydrolase
MKIRVGQFEYPLTEGLSHPTNNDIRYLRRASKELDGVAVTPNTIQAFTTEVVDSINGTDGFDLFEGERLANLTGMIFLARRKAGDNITYEDAGDFDLTDWEFIPEASDEPEAPKAPAEESAAPEA